MAVSLVIAYNVIVIDRQKEIVIRENKKIIMVEEKHNEEKPNYKKKESKSKEIKTPIIVRKNKKKESLTKDNDRLEKGGVIPSS